MGGWEGGGWEGGTEGGRVGGWVGGRGGREGGREVGRGGEGRGVWKRRKEYKCRHEEGVVYESWLF